MKEPNNLYYNLMSKETLHFVWGHLSRKQTVTYRHGFDCNFHSVWNGTKARLYSNVNSVFLNVVINNTFKWKRNIDYGKCLETKNITQNAIAKGTMSVTYRANFIFLTWGILIFPLLHLICTFLGDFLILSHECIRINISWSYDPGEKWQTFLYFKQEFSTLGISRKL